jgi:hypothetical protein
VCDVTAVCQSCDTYGEVRTKLWSETLKGNHLLDYSDVSPKIITMDLNYTSFEAVKRNELAHDRDQ